jgi:hypothetical protein
MNMQCHGRMLYVKLLNEMVANEVCDGIARDRRNPEPLQTPVFQHPFQRTIFPSEFSMTFMGNRPQKIPHRKSPPPLGNQRIQPAPGNPPYLPLGITT